jgi:CRISPR-associated protein Cas2
MAERTRYLLTYDIREARRLRRIHQVALRFGEPLQYSVFVCDLTRAELVAFKLELGSEMHQGEDSVALFDLGPPATRGLKCVEHLGVRRGLPEPGARVW